MDWLTFVDGIVGSVSWPIALVVVCYVLKKPIEGLFERLQEATHKETSLKFGSGLQATGPITTNSQVADALPQDALGLIQEGENIILEAFDSQGIDSDSDRLRILLKHFVNNQLRNSYSNAERYIFGSQLSLLQALNIAPVGGVEEAFIRSYYESAKSQYPEEYKDYDFQSWLVFLQTHGLINSEAGRYFVTVRGRGFLAYLAETGVSLERPY